MDQPAPLKANAKATGHANIFRSVLSLLIVAVLVHLTQSRDVLSDLTRPTVTGALRLLGLDAVDHGNTIAVGRLEVPWTRDCAGVNLLLVLLALTVWVNRNVKADWRFWVRLALMVPGAIAANIARVLTLIAYREAFYPSVESTQLHYFLGLIWLLPFVPFMVPKGTRPLPHVIMEALQAASVVALLAPMSGVPGGDTVAIAAVFGLAHCKVRMSYTKEKALATLVWLVLGLGICLTGMESLWMPWLLVCPKLVSSRWIFSFSGIVLTAATNPLFGLIPGAVWVTWIAIGFAAWRWLGKTLPDPIGSNLEALERSAGWLRFQAISVTCCFVLPFISSTVMARDQHALLPPSGTTYTSIENEGYSVRLANQPADIGLVWYVPHGTGRHHTLKVCLKYRGIEVTPDPVTASVYSDGSHWLREYYLVNGELVPEYMSYLLRTFRPWASPGVHLIFVAHQKGMTADQFKAASAKLAEQLHEMLPMTPLEKNSATAPQLAESKF